MRNYLGLLAVMGFLAIPMTYNSCAEHSASSLNGASLGSACLSKLAPGIEPLHAVLKTRCNSCHFQGTTSAPSTYYFADPDFGTAADGFKNVGPTKLYDKAHSNHFGGAGTPELIAEIDPLRADFEAAYDSYVDCVEKQTVGPGIEPPDHDSTPTKRTVAKLIPPTNPTTPVNLTWDLGTEMEGLSAAVPGGQFQISIRSETIASTGKTNYLLTAPAAKGGVSALEIRNIRVYLNNSLVALNSGGGTWTSLNNLASSARLHNLASGTGVMVLEANTSSSTNTLAIGFGAIQPSTLYPDFNPTTYARLTSTNNNVPVGERVFSQRCQSCHGTSGNLSLAANQLNMLKLTGRVVPFVPSASSVHVLANLPAGDASIMPPSGRIPDAEIRWIRDWILDGAP